MASAAVINRLRALLSAAAVTLIVAASTLAPSHVPAPLQVVQQAEAGLVNIAGARHSDSVALTPEQDFANRMAGDGVVFGHDFCFEAEVDQFRWANGYGADPLDLARPNTTTYVADDGTSCGSLESRHLVTTSTNPSDWWRPLAPLTGASNGTGVDDPAANGTLTLRTFTPTDGGDELLDLNNVGQYGNVAYHGDATFDGTSLWLQMRAKISANRCCVGSGPSGDEGGKILYVTNTRRSNSDQELVTNSFYEVTVLGADQNLFQMYRSGGASLSTDNGDSTIRQIGGAFNGGVCDSSPADASGCWFWPDDEVTPGAGDWVTLLYEIIPGLESANDTVIRVWKAEWGETSYTKIWDQSNVDLPYDDDMPRGFNALILSGYQNDITFTEEIWHRYDQIILSLEWIAPPQVYEGFAGNVRMFEHVELFAANEDYFYMPLRRVAGL